MGQRSAAAGGCGLGDDSRATPATLRYTRRIRAAIAKIAPDVIHSNGVKSHLIVNLAKPIQPVIWHIHDFVGSRPMMARLLRRRWNGATLVAVSEAVAQDVRAWLPGSAPSVVMNGIDVDRFSPGVGDGTKLDDLAAMAPFGSEPQGRRQAKEGTVRVGMVATYGRWKGQEIFLRAASELMREMPGVPVRFYIVGGPIYTTRGSQFTREELIGMARDLGIAKHVGLVPFQSDPVSVYRSLDIVVHTSTQPEPFGLTIAEAMACGRPVIVSAAGGASELFRDGVDGIGVRPGDVKGLADAIAKLVDSRERRAEMSEKARQTATSRFDRRRLGPALLAIYQTLVNPR